MKLFVFGLGYTALHFVRRYRASFEAITGTTRSDETISQCAAEGLRALRFDASGGDPAISLALADADAILVSVQPSERGDPVLRVFGETVAASPTPRSIVYLSTIGVYGDHDGAWVDETAALEACNPRQIARIAAERDWLALGGRTGKTVTVLRLAGIYGPGRNALHDLRTGDARRIDKPGQVFNRIHVTDIAGAIDAAVHNRADRHIFNVTDDEPAPAPDVVAYAAGLMGRTPPPLVAFADADMSPMARSFYSANRRVRNLALKSELGVKLTYPTFRSGLDALWHEGEGRS